MARVTILMYHVVAEPASDAEARYCCAPSRFDAQMRHLHESGARWVSLGQLADALDGKSDWPDGAVAVTFDDGFAETFVHALPVLARYRIPATMFALADAPGGSNEWMVRQGFPRRRLMSTAELREMSGAGVTIGSHTCTHPRLPDLDAKSKRAEIRGSRSRLEDILGCPVQTFAYPYGAFDDDARAAVAEAGYRVACSTRSGFNGRDVDRHLLRRIEVVGSDSLWKFRQKLKFGVNDVSALYPLRYYAGRLSARLGRRPET